MELPLYAGHATINVPTLVQSKHVNRHAHGKLLAKNSRTEEACCTKGIFARSRRRMPPVESELKVRFTQNWGLVISE
jgi:hypothetical protein